ncbi:hypothetical protein HYQ46_001953 [Verticillium longisporum]|nr:hypothetical protein HYQ46_001953 [Verticillium longisporum]
MTEIGSRGHDMVVVHGCVQKLKPDSRREKGLPNECLNHAVREVLEKLEDQPRCDAWPGLSEELGQEREISILQHCGDGGGGYGDQGKQSSHKDEQSSRLEIEGELLKDPGLSRVPLGFRG